MWWRADVIVLSDNRDDVLEFNWPHSTQLLLDNCSVCTSLIVTVMCYYLHDYSCINNTDL